MRSHSGKAGGRRGRLLGTERVEEAPEIAPPDVIVEVTIIGFSPKDAEAEAKAIAEAGDDTNPH